MAGGQRLISWLHPYSTSNVALNTRTCAHGPLMGHPNWAGCDAMVSPGKTAPLVFIKKKEPSPGLENSQTLVSSVMRFF
jgi:hypothetical protein